MSKQGSNGTSEREETLSSRFRAWMKAERANSAQSIFELHKLEAETQIILKEIHSTQDKIERLQDEIEWLHGGIEGNLPRQSIHWMELSGESTRSMDTSSDG
ncbi:MAG: hypothetical protein COA94_05335 [Rickettsiales bacterium]|nr:MAG: hypothetical protein COA94_05335 [Rickettsiales bacterium]